MELADPLLTTEGCTWLLNCLFEAVPEKTQEHCNIQLLNLLCADRLPGNENIDIRGCLARLDGLTEYIKGSIERTFRAYGSSPDYSYCKYQTWMAILVTRMKKDYGAAYSPQAKADLDAGIKAPFSDAGEVFINGLLREDRNRRWGTCGSIPVLVTAIARKLGYPVRLAVAKNHLYCRWEGEGAAFNIEASNPMGMAVKPDEHYRNYQDGVTPQYDRWGFYCRSLTPAEEFSTFMAERVYVLCDAKRLDETLLWSARALQFAPDNCAFAHDAYSICDAALKNRLRRKHPDFKIKEGPTFFYPIHDLVAMREWPLVETITGHYREALGETDKAREAFENACRTNFHGAHEQRNLQRFLRKHKLSPRARQRTFRPDVARFRRFKLACRPEEEADTLRRLADDLEKKGRMVEARDALHDLYLFNPCREEVFQRARAIEKQPAFQQQLKTLIDQGLYRVNANRAQKQSNADERRTACRIARP